MHIRRSRSRGWRATFIGASLVALLALPATAQEAAPADGAEAPAGDIAAVIPERLGGLEVVSVVRRGPENLTVSLGGGDEPPDAGELEAVEDLLAATGATVEQLTTAFWGVSSETTYAFVFGFQVEGQSPAGMTAGVVPLLAEDLVEPQQTTLLRAGRPVTLITEATAGDGDAGIDSFLDVRGIYVYASGDDLWAIVASEELVDQILLLLPAPGS